MPNTEIFLGSHYNATSYGGIEINGEGDSANIIFSDHNRKKSPAQLKVYQLSELKKLALFKDAQENSETESLINVWVTKKLQNHIIKYASDKQLALVFTSPQVDEDFSKLFEEDSPIDYLQVDYFKESKFVSHFRKKLDLPIDELEAIPGMDEIKIQLLLDNQSSLFNLIDKGATFEQLGLVPLNRLEKILKKQHELNRALPFVTIQQIFGISHSPPKILEQNTNHSKKGNQYLGTYGTLGEFSYQHSKNQIRITHRDRNTKAETSLDIFFSVLDKDISSQLHEANNLSSEKLLHNWYIEKNINKINQKVTVIYSPDTRQIFTETYDLQFPEELLKGRYHFLLLTLPYYMEKKFLNLLNEKNHTFETLRAYPGMTEEKLDILCQHYNEMTQLFKLGIEITDFASLDERRLLYVLSRFNEATVALEFVDAGELLGLNTPQIRHSAKFSPPPVKVSNDDNNNNNNGYCSIM